LGLRLHLSTFAYFQSLQQKTLGGYLNQHA
jgi:hypothetical protein